MINVPVINSAITVIPIPGLPANELVKSVKKNRAKSNKNKATGQMKKVMGREDFLKLRNNFSPLSKQNDDEDQDETRKTRNMRKMRKIQMSLPVASSLEAHWTVQ